MKTQILIVGGGLGGISAAYAALRRGRTVVMTEPTRWIGGQLTSQLVPLDEHRHIERTGANASYRELRDGIRDYYRAWFPLNDRARADPHLNPGAAWVSPVSHDPRVGLAVLESMLMPFRVTGQLTILLEHDVVAADVVGDRVTGVEFQSTVDGSLIGVEAEFVIDASETGDLLAIAGIEHVTGREAAAETGEPNAAPTADPTDIQSVTWCFAIDHLEGEDHTINQPADYAEFRAWRPTAWGGNPILGFDGPREPSGAFRSYRFDVNPDDDPAAIDTDHRNMTMSPDLWTYRRIAARQQMRGDHLRSDITVVNWPMNDYVGGSVFGVPDADVHRQRAKNLSLSLLYWLQTEAPRPDGGTGWKGLRLRADIAGTSDGLAMAPYIRESRRLRARHTILEHEVSSEFRGDRGAERFHDTVGVGHYFWLDMHATTGGRLGAAGQPSPFQIPLRALLPQRVRNVIAGAKNIGTTQISNGCYRLHPVEWSIGEAAGSVAAFCLEGRTEPAAVVENDRLLRSFQDDLLAAGVQLHWPEGVGT